MSNEVVNPQGDSVPSTSESSISSLSLQDTPAAVQTAQINSAADEIKGEIEKVISNHTLSMQSMVATQFKLKNKDAKKLASKIIKKQTTLNNLLIELREKETTIPLPKPPPPVRKEIESVVQKAVQGRGRGRGMIQPPANIGSGLTGVPESVQRHVRGSR